MLCTNISAQDFKSFHEASVQDLHKRSSCKISAPDLSKSSVGTIFARDLQARSPNKISIRGLLARPGQNVFWEISRSLYKLSKSALLARSSSETSWPTKTARPVLCEPAQSKCIWTCHKNHFCGNSQGKWRRRYHVNQPARVATLLGGNKKRNGKMSTIINHAQKEYIWPKRDFDDPVRRMILLYPFVAYKRTNSISTFPSDWMFQSGLQPFRMSL